MEYGGDRPFRGVPIISQRAVFIHELSLALLRDVIRKSGGGDRGSAPATTTAPLETILASMIQKRQVWL